MLKISDMFADHGWREPKVFRRGSKRAAISDANEHCHTGQPVHDYKPMVLGLRTGGQVYCLLVLATMTLFRTTLAGSEAAARSERALHYKAESSESCCHTDSTQSGSSLLKSTSCSSQVMPELMLHCARDLAKNAPAADFGICSSEPFDKNNHAARRGRLMLWSLMQCCACAAPSAVNSFLLPLLHGFASSHALCAESHRLRSLN
jgi:hypothetical protein